MAFHPCSQILALHGLHIVDQAIKDQGVCSPALPELPYAVPEKAGVLVLVEASKKQGSLRWMDTGCALGPHSDSFGFWDASVQPLHNDYVNMQSVRNVAAYHTQLICLRTFESIIVASGGGG